VATSAVSAAASDPYVLAAKELQQRLHKAHGLLNAFQRLSRAHPEAMIIERRSNVSRSEFLKSYYVANRPLVMKGLMSGWRAMTRWTPDYLKSKVGDELVAIMADFERWPEFRQASIIDVDLEAGEVLFVPVAWWHHVRTLEPSVMISFTNFDFPNSYDW
jgi:ribosomal protein L16 Arg81 hydroxylase